MGHVLYPNKLLHSRTLQSAAACLLGAITFFLRREIEDDKVKRVGVRYVSEKDDRLRPQKIYYGPPWRFDLVVTSLGVSTKLLYVEPG